MEPPPAVARIPGPRVTEPDPSDVLAAVAAATAAAAAAKAADAADAAAEAADAAAEDADAAADAADAAAQAAGTAADAAAAAADEADAAADAADAAAAEATAAFESSGPRGAAVVVVEETPVGAPRAPRQRVSGLGAVAAVEVLLLALGVLAVSVLGAGGPADRPSDVAHVTVPSPTVAGTEASRPEASRSASPGTGGTLATCRRVAEQQDVALGAAAVSLDDWQIHLGVMNKFAAEVVTLDDLEGFWEQTEVQATGGIRAFRAAARDLDASTADCPPPGKRMRTAALKNCAEDVESVAGPPCGPRRGGRVGPAAAADAGRARLGRPPRPQLGPAGCGSARGTSIGELEDYQRAARAVPDRTACSS